MSEVDSALGLPSLGSVVLEHAVREIRIVDWYPMIRGEREPFLRLVESPEGVKGLIGQWWDGPEPWRKRGGVPAASCTVHPDKSWFCIQILSLPEGITWQDVADELARLGAWTIHEKCETRWSWISDSGELMLERLDRGRYETYQCNAPLRRSGEAGKRAKDLYEYFVDLAARAAGGKR